jgi:hypothetical protein
MKQKTPHYKGKVILFLLCLIVMTPLLSALLEVSKPIDIIKDQPIIWDKKEIAYNPIWEKYAPITISDNWDLPLISTVKAEAYIDTHTESCGIDCSSTIVLKTYGKSPLIDDVRFYTITGENKYEQPIRSYKFYIKTNESEYEVNDYEYVCTPTGKLNINGTAETKCENKLVGTHIEKEPLWMPYNLGTEVDAGTYEIKLEGQKKPDRVVDWQIKTSNIWTTDWATWEAGWDSGYNTGLNLYFPLDNYKDSISGKNNLTDFEGSPTFNITNCLHGNCSHVSDSFTFQLPTGYGSSQLAGANNGTINFWFRFNNMLATNGIIGRPGATGYWSVDGANVFAPNGVWTGTTTPSITMFAGRWYMGTYTRNSSGYGRIYINGTLSFFGQSTSYMNDDYLTSFGTMDDSYPMDGVFDEIGLWNRTLSQSEITGLYNNGVGAFFSSASSVVLNSPSNNYISPTSSVNFNCTATVVGGATFVNRTIVLYNNDGTINQTNFSLITGTTNTSVSTLTLVSGVTYKWTSTYCDSDGDCGFASENRTVSVDTSAPSVNIVKPTVSMGYGKYNSNENLSWIITDSNFQSAWFNYNGTNISVYGATNSTLFNLTRTSAQNLTFYANDSIANFNTTFLSWAYKVFAISESYPTSILEGSEGTFLMNITSTSSSIVPYLVYDGTSYLGTSVKNGSNYYLSNTIDIPTVTSNSNKTFYWSMLIDDASYVNTTATNISVNNFAVDNCSINSNKILTLLLKNEEANTMLTGESSNIEAEIEIYSLNGLLIGEYNAQWLNNSNVSICINSTLSGEQYLIDMIGSFSIDNYVKEFWYIDKQSLNATVIPITISLMDLLATDSTSFLFNYFSSSGLIVDNIIVHTWRKYIGDGNFLEVERSKQNEDGQTIVHLVEEDVIYYFTITLDDVLLYTSETYTALCQAVPYSITLNQGGGSAEFGTDWDLVDNGGYSVTSSSTTRIVTLNFSTTTPSTFNLTVYELDSEANLVAVGSSQTTSLSSALTVLIPLVSGNKTYFASVYQDGAFIRSYWINMNTDSRIFIGNTLSIFIAILIILSLGLLAVSEGSGTIVFVLLGVFLTSILGLVNFDTGGLGISILTYLIIAGGIIIWKITQKSR